MKIMKFILMLVLVTGFFYDSAYACSCMTAPPPRQALKEAKAVFAGEVISKEVFEVKNNFGTEPVVRVKFLVSQTWKGVQGGEVEVYTSAFNPACGYSFTKSKKYLVYAYPDRWKLDVLETGICNRTTETKDAKKDLRAIGKGSEPKSQKSAFDEKTATPISGWQKIDEEKFDFNLGWGFAQTYMTGVKSCLGEICSGNYSYGFDSFMVSRIY